MPAPQLDVDKPLCEALPQGVCSSSFKSLEIDSGAADNKGLVCFSHGLREEVPRKRLSRLLFPS